MNLHGIADRVSRRDSMEAGDGTHPEGSVATLKQALDGVLRHPAPKADLACRAAIEQKQSRTAHPQLPAAFLCDIVNGHCRHATAPIHAIEPAAVPPEKSDVGPHPQSSAAVA